MKTSEKVDKGDVDCLDLAYFSEMKRCTKCILPETFPGIEFDEEGECNYCRDYQPVEVLGVEELQNLQLMRYVLYSHRVVS